MYPGDHADSMQEDSDVQDIHLALGDKPSPSADLVLLQPSSPVSNASFLSLPADVLPHCHTYHCCSQTDEPSSTLTLCITARSAPLPPGGEKPPQEIREAKMKHHVK